MPTLEVVEPPNVVKDIGSGFVPILVPGAKHFRSSRGGQVISDTSIGG